MRLIRAYWSYLRTRALEAEDLGGRLIELQWQTALWFVPLGMFALYGVWKPTFDPPMALVAFFCLVSLSGLIFIGAAIAVSQVEESIKQNINRKD